MFRQVFINGFTLSEKQRLLAENNIRSALACSTNTSILNSEIFDRPFLFKTDGTILNLSSPSASESYSM